MPEDETTNKTPKDSSSLCCSGNGVFHFDLRKLVLWTLLAVGVAVTWGLWSLLCDIQEKYDSQKAAEYPSEKLEIQEQ